MNYTANGVCMSATLLLASVLSSAHATENSSLINPAGAMWTLHPHYEIGMLAPITHRIQLGQDGTDFDFIADGGQDNLFQYQRFEMWFQKNGQHHLGFLLQPCDLRTTSEVYEDTQFDTVVFPKGTPMDYRYGFDYYRATYMYDWRESTSEQLSLGVGLQIRNATLDFRSVNGELQNTNRDIGPVPLLTTAGKFERDNNQWWGFDAAGAFAPIKYINGSDSDVVGAILDASIRGGIHLQQGADAFVNLRYIGGGAEGTDSTPDRGKDGYVLNWLNFVTLSVGFELQ